MPTQNMTTDYELKKLDGVTLTVTVKETREYRIRKHIALALIKLGAWVIGFDVEVE